MQRLVMTGKAVATPVSFTANLEQQSATFKLNLSLDSGRSLGSVSVTVDKEGQLETETTEAIPSWDDFLAGSATGREILAGLTKLAMEFAAYSKELTLE